MKKRVVSLLTAFVMIFSMLAMTGCSIGGSNELVGTWVVDGVTVLTDKDDLGDAAPTGSPKSFDISALGNVTVLMSIKMLFQEGSEIEFESNGRATLSMGVDVRYKFDGNKLKITAQGDALAFDVDKSGDSMTLTVKKLAEVKLSRVN